MLDVAHGTGIWVYEVAKSNDNVDVLGIELHDRSPPREDGIPFNVTFASPVDFTESNWGLRENFYDLLRMNQLCGSVADWRSLYQTVFK